MTLLRFAAVLQQASGTTTCVSPVDPLDLPRTVAAVVTVGTPPERVPPMDVPVVTDRDAAAVVLAAKLLTTLARTGLAPDGGGVVIAGGAHNPVLGSLLLAAGVRDLTVWNEADAGVFPLPEVAARAAAVVDLVGGVAATRLKVPVVALEGEHELMLALPGLLDAVVTVPEARLDAEVLLACALALVMATPSHRVVPDLPVDVLARRVSEAALSVPPPEPGAGAD